MTPIVLDASAGVELLLHSAAGRRVATAIDGSAIWVPEHFYVEVEAAIRRLELRGVVTPAQAMATVDRLLASHPSRVGPDSRIGGVGAPSQRHDRRRVVRRDGEASARRVGHARCQARERTNARRDNTRSIGPAVQVRCSRDQEAARSRCSEPTQSIRHSSTLSSPRCRSTAWQRPLTEAWSAS